MAEKKKLVNLDNVRGDQQREDMEAALAQGHCMFCKENLGLYHTRPIIYYGSHWLLTENQYPYPNTSIHLLIISKNHAEKFSDLDREAGLEFFEILRLIEHQFNIKSGALFSRFGDIQFNGATINHLHTQVIIPDIKNKDSARIILRVEV